MTQPVLVAGAWRAAVRPAGQFSAVDPSTRQSLPEVYPISSLDDVNAACEAGREAAATLRGMPDREERIARFLEDYAARIEASADALCEMATRETAYPITPRLKAVELPRTTNQLRQGAAAARGREFEQLLQQRQRLLWAAGVAEVLSKQGVGGAGVLITGMQDPYLHLELARELDH